MSIDSLIADAQSFASSALNDATNSLDSATSVINGLTSGVVTFDLPPTPDIQDFVPANVPILNAVNFQLPDRPDPLEAPIDMPDPLAGLMDPPDNLDKPPTLNLESIPRPAQLQNFSGSVPSVTSYSFPTAPDIILPPEPVLDKHDVPTKPNIVLPDFTGVKPADLAAAPTDYAERFTAAYREAAPSMVAALDGHIDSMLTKFNPQYHAQMSAIEAKLTKYLAGGTALTPAVENAIMERTKDKVNAEARRVRDTAYSEAAKRGFTMPNGALLTAALRARQDGADNNARAAIDIAVKMAEMEQQNMQFAVTTSASLRNTMLSAALSYHGNLITINGQALDYAKSILNAIIEVYNTLVKEYEARLEGYKAEAQVFDTRMRGAMAYVELYKAEIDALQALTQVDVAKVGIYRERINALMSLVEVYKVRVDAVVSKAGLERIKLDIFQSQVQAYSAQTQAKSAEWQAYSAAVSGEEAKVRAYGAQVEAYRSQWQAYGQQVESKNAQLKAIATTNEARASYGVARFQAFRTMVDAESSRVGAEINFQNQLLQEYSIANQAAATAASASADAYKARNQVLLSTGEVAVNALIKSAELDVTRTKAIADSAMSAGSVYGQLAASALSGMNTLVQKSE